MRFRRSLLGGSLSRPIDLLPVVNIVFLLLIFLAILFGLVLSQQGVRINMPKLLTSDGLVYENIEIVVNSGDNVYLNGALVDSAGLKDMFAQFAKRKLALLIKSDKSASLGKVMEICTLARNLGISQINIVSR